jgi:predicted nucleotide-binding protein
MTTLERIEDYIKAGENLRSDPAYYSWQREVVGFLSEAFDASAANKFIDIKTSHWSARLKSQLGKLKGLLARLEAQKNQVPFIGHADIKTPISRAATKRENHPFDRERIFIVHGHDNEAKETIARFIERIGLEAVILHEQPSSGKTVIEKFEEYANVSFALVILTPDDVGAVKATPDRLQRRARQNVIFELGFFIGRLGRKRVSALYKEGVELPSDYQGTVYIKLDDEGAWKLKLIQELMESGIPVDMSKVR